MNELVLKIFKCFKDEFESSRDELEKLDSVGGDGDLGIVMRDGFADVYEYMNTIDEDDIGKEFYLAGKKLNQVASSSMGTLLSSGFINAGKNLKGKSCLDKESLVILVESIAEGIQKLGKSKEGEKTILDAICPAARAMKENVELDETKMLEKGLLAAQEGIEKAKDLVAKQGRLAYRKEASIGVTDPGTVAAYHLIHAIYIAVK